MPAVKEAWTYEIIREGEDTILRVNCERLLRSPSIEDDAVYMAKTVDTLLEVGKVTKIVFYQKRDYEYDYDQTMMLKEIAGVYAKLASQKDMFSYEALNFGGKCSRYVNQWYTQIQNLIFRKLKEDPIGTYVELKRRIRDERISIQKIFDEKEAYCRKKYISILMYVLGEIEKTRMVMLAKPYLPGYKVGTRDVYREIFHPIIKPDFMFTKLMANYPTDGEEMDNYSIDKETEVTLFKFPDTVKYLYHLMPPEFKLTEEQYDMLDMARNIMAEHKPTKAEFVDPRRMREVFYNVGHDLIGELINYRNVKMSSKDVDLLTRILVRYTVGFGLIEVLLQDEKIQDISVNSPMGRIPIFIVHGDYADCDTNIIPTLPEAESWASKLRMLSGRPLDEANPILDTELRIPGADARVSVITEPLDPTGLAYSFRRHRDKPWTLPLFMKYKMINPLGAGILSFMVDGTRSMLIAGTRSSGKSSFLTSLIVEIMRRYRLITVEDSVSEDSKIFFKDGKTTYFCDIKRAFDALAVNNKLEQKQGREIIRPKGMYVHSISKTGKVCWKKANLLMRHKVKKPLYSIITRTGRKLKITGDHSIFCLADKRKHILCEEKISNLCVGNRIAVPRKMPLPEKTSTALDGLEMLRCNNISDKHSRKIFLKLSKKVLLSKKGQIKEVGKKKGYTKGTVNRWLRIGWVPFHICSKLPMRATDVTEFKYGRNSSGIPLNIMLNSKLMCFLGLWLADGCFDKNSVIFSVSSKEERALVKNIAKRFGFSTKMHSDKFSLIINSASLKFLIGIIMAMGGNAYTKKIPTWVLTLNNHLRAAFLKGLFSGDGCVSDKEIIISLASRELLDDVQTILLNWGIIFRINRLRKHKSKENDRTRDGRISSQECIKLFKKHICFLQKKKIARLDALSKRVSTHASSDKVILSSDVLKELLRLCPRKIFNKQDYIIRENGIGIKKLKRIAAFLKTKGEVELSDYLAKIAESDILWDEIASIKKLQAESEYVYDISVPETESFIANNILAHNTLELPTDSLRRLGFNIQPLKVASALVRGSSEVSASDGIRSTLRLGDSSLIIGEVRSKEALALYEAMRVGAAANVVAGTIHGDSPYGVFDRVVNDIGVPKTSFKATDLIIVANPIRSADGIHRNRRITQITEVRKHWENDPLLENGFVDLMKYDSKKDELEASDDLINGESDVLKAIAANIPDFAGNWDALWNNIELRTKAKKAQVDYATKLNDMDLLEAPFTIKCNDQLHILADKIKAETGFLDPKQIYFEWETWLKRELKKRKVK